jgi:galactose oxidase-like protein
MRLNTSVVCIVLAVTCSHCLAAEISAPTDLKNIPANTWVPVSQGRKVSQYFGSAWYLPATDEFFIWGKVGSHRSESKWYEVNTLSLSDKAPEWRQSFPLGKEKTWSGGKFPNWGCGCHRLRHKPDRPWLKNIRDMWFGSGKTNVVKFTTTDGVVRPTRAPSFNQGCYDSKRGRMLYYVGGKTFAYDARKREWTDLKATPPLACDGLIMGMMAYDPVGDQAVLFGGCFALNPWGGAKTWIYDCAKNKWRRPEDIKDEPPLRCGARMVYDSKNKVMVLFGGDAQAKILADTWVFDPATMRWTEKKPAASPPPLDRYAACFVEKQGVVFLATNSRRRSKSKAWTYDVAKNEWTPVKGALPGANVEWMSCDYSTKDDVVLLAALGGGTYVYRLDPATAKDEKRKGVAPGTWAWNGRSRKMMTGILAAPKPDRAATEKRLKELPANTPTLAKYPGHLTSKTWSSATIDTDRGVVLYIGGGHSGYNGEDLAMYDAGINRWSFDTPPNFTPFLYNYGSALFGWTYGFKPTSQHTYRWYTYDPQSKTMVYCPRRLGILNGMTVMLEDDPAKAFKYDRKKHGQFTWVYDTVRNRWYRPIPSRPFGTSWSLALVGTPKGVFAKSGGTLWHAKVTVKDGAASIAWTAVDKKSPSGSGEFQPLVYDSKRDRLLFVAVPGRGKPTMVWEHPAGPGAWKKLDVTGKLNWNSREVVYDVANDCLVAMPPKAVMVMDCTTDEWKQIDVTLPKGSYGTECAMVYDPIRKVCVMLIPSRFSGRMQVVLFRYDPKTVTYRK